MFDVSSRAKLSVSALAERKIASARPRKYGLLLRAEEEMLLYGQALASCAKTRRSVAKPAGLDLICLFEQSPDKRFAFVPRENRFPPIGSWPEGMLFRIMH
jgi:hypothetical protein